MQRKQLLCQRRLRTSERERQVIWASRLARRSFSSACAAEHSLIQAGIIEGVRVPLHLAPAGLLSPRALGLPGKEPVHQEAVLPQSTVRADANACHSPD